MNEFMYVFTITKSYLGFLGSHRSISRTEFLTSCDELRTSLEDLFSSLIFRGILVIILLTRILVDRSTPLSVELRFRLFA